VKIRWTDEARIEVRCSVCNEKFHVRVGDLRAGTGVTHHKCGTTFDTTEAAQEFHRRS